MMNRLVLIALALAACDPIDIGPLDLGLGSGPIHGDRDVATFELVDGCTTSDWLTGCAKTMPPFAIGARARFIVGAVSEDTSTAKRIDAATFASSDPSVAVAGRDADGFVVMQTVGAGSATIELHDRGGAVIDSVVVHAESVAQLEGDSSPLILEGARIGAKITARGPGGEVLYGRGAITATLGSGLELDGDTSGFFVGSDQVVIRGIATGDTNVKFSIGMATLSVPYQVVSRDQVTTVSVFALGGEAGATKQQLFAEAKIGDLVVRGGPACDWRIVSGGGDGAALAAGTGDDTRDSLFAIFDQALVYGEGNMTVECRANDQAVGQTTIHLGP